MTWVYCIECGDMTDDPVYSIDEPQDKFCSFKCLDVNIMNRGRCSCEGGPKLLGREHWSRPRCGRCHLFPTDQILKEIHDRHYRILSNYAEGLCR